MCVILVVGTIGEKLADSPDLFLSQDGGVTWIMVRGGMGGVHVHGVYVSVSECRVCMCNEGRGENEELCFGDMDVWQ